MSITDLPPRKELYQLSNEQYASPHRTMPWDRPSAPSTCDNDQCACHTHGVIAGTTTR